MKTPATEATRAAPSPLLTERDVAELLRVSVRTLQDYRCSGRGPIFIKIGRRIVYRQADVDAFIEARAFASTSAYEGVAA